MDILTSTQLYTPTWYHIISVMCCIGGFILMIVSIANEETTAIIICIIIMVLGIFGWVFLPNEQPTGRWKYTVHITDDAKYKELVDTGYQCSLLFVGEPIYEIIGDEIN